MTGKLIGAVEAGGTKFIAAVANSDGEILARTRVATGAPAETLAAVRSFFEAATRQHGAIGGIGIASFGPIDIDPTSPAYGTFTTTPKPGWSGTRFQTAFGQFNVPVIVETDVNGSALGEWLAGAGRGCRTIAYTTIGTGIGTGVLHDGAALAGISHYEAGHIRVPRDKMLDPFAGVCPYHGDCLEGLASGPAIVARFGSGLDGLSGEAQSEAVTLIASYVADAAATLVLLHMPDRLIFGGGVMKAPGLIEAVRHETERRLGNYIRHPRLSPGLADYIVPPELGDDAGITGAIELGRRALAQRRD